MLRVFDQRSLALVRSVLCGFLICLQVACGKSTPLSDSDATLALFEGSPRSASDRDSLYQEMETVEVHSKRGSNWNPVAVLNRLHSGFNIDAKGGLIPFQVEGRKAYLLKTIDAQKLQELAQSTYPDTHRSGFDLLQTSFWEKVSQIQKIQDPYSRTRKQNLRIGFLEHDPSFQVNGVFYSGPDVILLDIFAIEGTLEHEFEHFLQLKRFNQIAVNREQYHRAHPKSLPFNDECVKKLTHFFQELDSTTTELHNWEGVFDTIEVSPESHHQLTEDGSLQDRFMNPQAELLLANLRYPGQAGAAVKEPICSAEVVKAVTTIRQRTDTFAQTLAVQQANQFTALRKEDLKLSLQVLTQCQGTIPQAVDSDACKAAKARLPQIASEGAQLAALMDSEFKDEAQNRPNAILNALNELPEDQKQQLCVDVPGFELLSNCLSN